MDSYAFECGDVKITVFPTKAEGKKGSSVAWFPESCLCTEILRLAEEGARRLAVCRETEAARLILLEEVRRLTRQINAHPNTKVQEAKEELRATLSDCHRDRDAALEEARALKVTNQKVHDEWMKVFLRTAREHSQLEQQVAEQAETIDRLTQECAKLNCIHSILHRLIGGLNE